MFEETLQLLEPFLGNCLTNIEGTGDCDMERPLYALRGKVCCYG